MAKKCPDCPTYNFEMPADEDQIVIDYQSDLRKKKVKLNKYQVLWKIIREWKQSAVLP